MAAVSVDVESGAALKEMRRAGPVQVTLTARVETGWYRSKLPEVRIPGSREPDRFVLVGAHYCAWHEGITDNATGDACVLEMAKLLWKGRASLDRSVRLCWWPGHSHGRYSGSTWYADTFFTDLAEGGLAYYNIDSPGVKGATVYYCRHTCAELEHYCRSVIARVTGQRERTSIPADARGGSIVSGEWHALVFGLSVPPRGSSGSASLDRRIGQRVVVAYRA